MIIEKKNYKRSNWKNGLGFTNEIAIYPADASLARGDFLWRLSSARIEKASPFSLFPAHDRTLVVLQGAGIRLLHTFEEGEESETVSLPLLEPYDFPGDVPSRCELVQGPITDFSIFTKTGEINANTVIQTLDADEEFLWSAEGKWNYAFAVQHAVQTESGTLVEGDSYSCSSGEVTFTASEDGATLLLVSLY